jgi:hypothetical protein
MGIKEIGNDSRLCAIPAEHVSDDQPMANLVVVILGIPYAY